MENFQEVFLIILSLFANLKLMCAFYHEKFLVYKLETFKNCKKVNKAHYDYDYSCNLHFFILCNIWSTVKNYFLKNLRPPWKNPLSPFYSLPSKNSKIASLPLFANIENFLDPPAEREGGHCVLWASNSVKPMWSCEVFFI